MELRNHRCKWLCESATHGEQKGLDSGCHNKDGKNDDEPMKHKQKIRHKRAEARSKSHFIAFLTQDQIQFIKGNQCKFLKPTELAGPDYFFLMLKKQVRKHCSKEHFAFSEKHFQFKGVLDIINPEIKKAV